MFGIGQTELIIIVVFAFLLFGPDKLPQMGRTIGRAIRQFRETQQKVTSVVQTEVIDPMAAAASAAPSSKVAPAVLDEDADADAGGETDVATVKAAEARKETFAERRARLAAEKAAREAGLADDGTGAVAVDAGDAATAIAGSAPVSIGVGDEPEGVTAPDSDPAATGQSAEDAIASLYARRPRKRAKAADAAFEADATADSEEGGEQ